jgi:hypothetical protein
MATATASVFRVDGRSAHHHSTVSSPKTNTCASFRSTTSTASPVSRSGCADSQKITVMTAIGAGARLAVRAIGLTLPIVTTVHVLGFASAAAGSSVQPLAP